MALTAWAVLALLDISDQFLFNFLPKKWQPDTLIGFRIPGLGILLTLLIIFVTGAMARNYAGKRILATLERVMASVPVLRGVHSALRQFLESMFIDRNQAFRKVVLIEYPRKGLYTLAFVTGSVQTGYFGEATQAIGKMRAVFVPTTPNPTSGFLLFVPVEDCLDVPLRVDEAFRLVVSGGVLTASSKVDLFERLRNAERQPAGGGEETMT